jgi:hypothetical protein
MELLDLGNSCITNGLMVFSQIKNCKKVDFKYYALNTQESMFVKTSNESNSIDNLNAKMEKVWVIPYYEHCIKI